MNPTFNSRTAGLVLVAVAWAFFLALIGSPEVLLFTAPVFLLAAPLALGRYIGEEIVVRLARTVRPGRRGRSVAFPSRFETARDSILGSRLIASNLAGRAPPAAAV
ncbi:MAG: hypothetical protein IPK93_07025 [Solirubrobacterales bacterium]|nr:hypothetical protein [Solirubrobacterales bacterium]